MGRFDFVSPGAMAGSAIQEELMRRQMLERQAMLDEQRRQEAEADRAARQQQLMLNAEEQNLRRQQMTQTAADRAAIAERQQRLDAQAASKAANERGMNQLIGGALMQGPVTPESARQIAGMSISEGMDVPGIVAEAMKPPKPPGRATLNQGDVLVDEETGEVIARGDPRTFAPSSGSGGITPTSEANLILRMQTAWDRARGSEREMDRQYNLMQTALRRFNEGDRLGGSEGVRVTFAKILDPTSVVRESEFARQGLGLSLLQRLEGLTQRYGTGGGEIPAAALADMVKTAGQFVEGLRAHNTGVRERTARTAARYGIPEEVVFTDLPTAAEPSPTTSGAPPPTTTPTQPPPAPATVPATGGQGWQSFGGGRVRRKPQ